MTTVKSIARNNLFLFSAQIISLVFGIFYFVYMAKYLGAKNLGILSFALSLTVIVGLIGDLGLSSLATREVSRNQALAPKYLGNILLLKILLALVTFGFVIIIINNFNYSEQTIKVVYIITISNSLTSISQIFNSIFQAFERFEFISISTALTSILMFAGVFFAIRQEFDLIAFALIYLVVNAIILLYSVSIYTWKFAIPSLKIDWPFWKQIVLESIPFWLNSVFVIIYFKIDMVMLSMMSGDAAVGWYSASYRLIDALAFVPAVFMSTLYPVFSRFYVTSRDSLEFVFKKSFKFLTVIAVPIGIGTTILAEKIILVIYGEQYFPSVPALQILIWASVMSFINYTPATYFTSTDRQRALMIFTFTGAILNIILNYLLIPKFSFNGAAVATVTAELVVGILMVMNIHNIRNLSFILSNVIFKCLAAGSLMAMFLTFFLDFNLIPLILFAAVIYFIALYVIRGFEKEDINLFKQVFGR